VIGFTSQTPCKCGGTISVLVDEDARKTVWVCRTCDLRVEIDRGNDTEAQEET
jgi:hypothetical protein